jgi:hypothetical protein
MTGTWPACDGLTESWDGCEAWASEAAWEQACLDGDCTPALADRFQITDLQKWLDLCA